MYVSLRSLAPLKTCQYRRERPRTVILNATPRIQKLIARTKFCVLVDKCHEFLYPSVSSVQLSRNVLCSSTHLVAYLFFGVICIFWSIFYIQEGAIIQSKVLVFLSDLKSQKVAGAVGVTRVLDLP